MKNINYKFIAFSALLGISSFGSYAQEYQELEEVVVEGTRRSYTPDYTGLDDPSVWKGDMAKQTEIPDGGGGGGGSYSESTAVDVTEEEQIKNKSVCDYANGETLWYGQRSVLYCLKALIRFAPSWAIVDEYKWFDYKCLKDGKVVRQGDMEVVNYNKRVPIEDAVSCAN